MNIAYIILSFVVGYFLATHLTARYYSKKIKLNEKLADAMKVATDTIANNLMSNNKMFDGLKADRDKKYMEKQLKLKLETEAKLRKVDEKTLSKLKETGCFTGID